MASRTQPTYHRTTTASGMRRNLFNSNLSRRPTAASCASTSATSATTLQLADEATDDRDIVARDEEGNYRLEMPNVGPLPRDDEMDAREAEIRLIETYRNQNQHIDPNELKATLHASLQAKVESLEEDRWMFRGR